MKQTKMLDCDICNVNPTAIIFDGHNTNCSKSNKSCENPSPLTKEQLMELSGTPVWVEIIVPTKGKRAGWALVYKDSGSAALERWSRVTLWYDDYGKEWVAYPSQFKNVRAAHWEPYDSDCTENRFVCSNCRIVITRSNEYNFCPICGAYMRSE